MTAALVRRARRYSRDPQRRPAAAGRTLGRAVLVCAVLLAGCFPTEDDVAARLAAADATSGGADAPEPAPADAAGGEPVPADAAAEGDAGGAPAPGAPGPDGGADGTPLAEVVCDDGEDDDADGLIDCRDPDCAAAACPRGFRSDLLPGPNDGVGAVALADLDGDGDQDAIAGLPGGVVWFANDGGGRFTRHPLPDLTLLGATRAPGTPAAIHAVELDGAAPPEVLIADPTAQRVWLLLRVAGPDPFCAEVAAGSTLASAVRGLAPGDLDGDGDPDLVAVRYLSVASEPGGLYWLEHQGVPRLLARAPTRPIDGGWLAGTAAAVADLDGDGDRDVVAGSYSQGVAWWPNDGAGSFGVRRTLSSLRQVSSVAVADVDGDGDVDVLHASHFPTNSTVYVLENQGGGLFTERALGATVTRDGFTGLVTPDVDRDGAPDVLAAGVDDRTVMLFANDGAAGFAERLVATVPATAAALAAGDVDGDGWPDLIAADRAEGALVLVRQEPGNPPRWLGPGDAGALVVESGAAAPDGDCLLRVPPGGVATVRLAPDAAWAWGSTTDGLRFVVSGGAVGVQVAADGRSATPTWRAWDGVAWAPADAATFTPAAAADLHLDALGEAAGSGAGSGDLAFRARLAAGADTGLCLAAVRAALDSPPAPVPQVLHRSLARVGSDEATVFVATDEVADVCVEWGAAFERIACSYGARRHELVVRHGLGAGGRTPYRLSVAAQDTPSRRRTEGDLTLRAAAPADGTTRFAVIADSQATFGSDGAFWRDTLAAVAGHVPDLVILPGDVIAQPSLFMNALLRGYLEVIAPISAEVPFYPVPGNHDRTDRAFARDEWTRELCLPESTAGGELFYSFDHGPVHFIGLDSYTARPTWHGIDDAQIAWLEADLAQTDRPWIVAYTHFPIVGWDESQWATANHAIVHDIFAAWGVDVVFTGHRHTWNYTVRDGVAYAMAPAASSDMLLDANGEGANGGDGLSASYPNAEGGEPGSLPAADGTFYGYLLVEATPTALCLEARDVGGGDAVVTARCLAR